MIQFALLHYYTSHCMFDKFVFCKGKVSIQARD